MKNKNFASYYHGTSYENAMKIIKEGFTSPQTNWNCCNGEETYFYKEDRFNMEEVLHSAVGSAQITSALQNSQSDKICILRVEIPEDSNIYISPDYSVDDAITNETAVVIKNDELNAAISTSEAILSYAVIEHTYNPYLRFVYLSNINDEFINIDNLSKAEVEAFNIFQRNASEISGLYEDAIGYQDLEDLNFIQVKPENV